MKRIHGLVALGLGLALVSSLGALRAAHAEGKPYRVVFDLTSRDSLDQKAVVRWIRELSAASPDVQMEVVMYGKGFELVMPDRSTQVADVQEAVKRTNVTFKVCEIAMKNNKIEKSQLFKEVQT